LYLPTGKAGRGSLELTRLQERIERTQTAAKRAERRLRRAAEQREPAEVGLALWQRPRPRPADEDEQQQDDRAAESAAQGETGAKEQT